MTDEAIAELVGADVPVARACAALGRARATHYRRHPVTPKPAVYGPPTPAKPQPRALSPHERRRVLDVLHEPRFVDKAPHQVWAELLDEDEYFCSIATMYRLLAAHGETRERRRQATHPATVKPELVATAPNQVWSWDISRLRGPVLRSWFYLYVVIDIFSRKIVAWTIDTAESDKVARRLVHTACRREGINPDELTLHSDRGAQMTSTTLAELLEDLGVTRSLSRPRVSNDNPFSEANFKTAKYRPDYPARFDNIDQARAWMRRFAHWYNHVHYHSGIGHLHPADVHHGTAGHTVAARQNVLDHAYAANPERFRGQPPRAARPPAVAWINKPTIHTET